MKQNLNPAIGFGGQKRPLDRGVYYMQDIRRNSGVIPA